MRSPGYGSDTGHRAVFLFALLLMGFSGIVAQVLLLRELLIVFSGNEFVIGIILANWLIIEAAGSFLLGRCIESIRRRVEAFVVVQMLFSIFLPLMVYLTRNLRLILSVSPGEGLGFLHILGSSFFILLPVTLPHGALFTFGCKVYSGYSHTEQASSVGKVYLYETLGTIAGGLTFTYLMIPRCHAFQIAFFVSLLNLTSCLSLLIPFWTKKSRMAFAVILILPLIFTGYLLFSGRANEMHRSSIASQWPGQKVISYQNSIYGNITLVESEGQYTFFSDGVPIITTPDPDTTFVEEFAHISMLSHPEPQDILVLSGGAGGLMNEILKHPTVKRVDYAELDPLLLELIRQFPIPITQLELSDSRVNIRNLDGRLFVQSTPDQYDLILMGLSIPSDLQVNRMFTEEFFLIAKEKLKHEGLLALTLPGSLTYLSDELRDLNACILDTLRTAYPYVRVIPGDFNLFLASSSPHISTIEAPLLSRRLGERSIRTNLLNQGYMEYRLHRRWQDWFSGFMEEYEGRKNSDFLPTAVFHSLAHWNSLFSSFSLGWFERVNLKYIIIFISVVTLSFGILSWRVRRLSRLSIPLAIMNTGFAGMLLDLVIIFAFQTLYGYVFYQVGILITVFMVGTAGGSLLVTSLLERIRKDTRLFMIIELGIILFACSLPLVFLALHRSHEYPGMPVVFSVLSFISGFLIGSQFPLAAKIHLRYSPKLGETAGLLYGADLFGGWIGGLMGGIVLLPVLGVMKTCVVIAMIKLSSLSIVISNQ
jgi:spermidine synthase